MESIFAHPSQKIAKPLLMQSNLNKILLIVLAVSVLSGVGTGYFLSSKSQVELQNIPVIGKEVKNASQDTKTFRDFAEGVIKPISVSKNSNEYSEGTHILEREGAYPVTLTSSVVDLSLYEGKKVKVFGETQKALKAGWLMDVGKVEDD